jgi:membrane-associated phospholipid phosphatase
VWAARTALLVAGIGLALFASAALLVHGGAPAWDTQAFRVLNGVSPGLAAWLTPITKLFLPAGIAVAAVIAAVYSSVRTRSLWPIAFGAGAAAIAWALANLAKHAASRPRPYTVVADATLRQQPAHGSSFPSSHAAVALAVAVALVAFLPRWGAAVAIIYAAVLGWSRIYLGVHYPLDVAAGFGIGCAVGGLVAGLERVVLLGSPSMPVSPAASPCK